MKKLFIIFSCSALLSCSENDSLIDERLLGTWELIEIYQESGIGSEESKFEPVQSDVEITFFIGGKLSSNGNFCSAPVINGEGTYSVEDSTITVQCTEPTTLSFELIDKFLIISYSCFEGCAEKYVKK